MKHCVLCLANRLHAVGVRTMEFAGITYSTKAALVCTSCGLEREVGGDAARPLIEMAVPRATIVETMSREVLEGAVGRTRPAGTEWLIAEPERRLAA